MATLLLPEMMPAFIESVVQGVEQQLRLPLDLLTPAVETQHRRTGRVCAERMRLVHLAHSTLRANIAVRQISMRQDTT
jgi:hypothetical protein